MNRIIISISIITLLSATTIVSADSFDWRSATIDGTTGDWTTPIKNQGGLDSCYVFASVGATESAINIYEGNPNYDLDLSEQDYISCGDYDCYGAIMEVMACRLTNYGFMTETCFPYEESWDTPCEDKCSDWEDNLIIYEATGTLLYDYGEGIPRNTIKDKLEAYGPLYASIYIMQDFYGDTSWDDNGVYLWDGTTTGYGSHSINIVGYADTPSNPNYDGYWIIKNSWGDQWGPWGNGFFGWAYGQDIVYNDDGDTTNIEDSVSWLEVLDGGDDYITGDTNGDGQFLANDIHYFAMYYLGATGYSPNYYIDDIDQNGDFNANDIRYLAMGYLEASGYNLP